MTPRKRLIEHINFIADFTLVLAIVVIMSAWCAGVGLLAGYMVRVDREQQIYDKGYQQCLVDKAMEE